MKTTYTKSMLQEAVKVCNSIPQMLIYFGLKNTGGNWNAMKMRLVKNNVDYSHFSRRGEGISKPLRTVTDPNHYLKIWDRSKQINTDGIKKKLLGFGVLENKCYRCGLVEWLGEPINLELHHINGDRWDNRLENLVVLCPNCHSKTDNYKGLNK